MILEKLKTDVVLGDGGAIFELERRGYISAGPFTPEVVLEYPQAVRQMQEEFVRCGSDVLQAVTYYAHEEKLRVRGLETKVETLNASAMAIAREVANRYGAMVAGNLSNTWVYDADDSASHAETRRQFDAQIASQLGGQPDLFIAETLEYLGEALIALDAIRAAGVPSMITLGFKYADRTLDGVMLEEAFARLEQAGADIVGINCFRGPDQMLPLAERLRGAVSCPIATQPVAYRTSDEKPYFQVLEYDGRIAFPLELDPLLLSRRDMADYAVRARQIGVNFIGGCCGTASHHIRAMAEAVGRTVPASRFSPELDKHTIIGSGDHVRERDARILAEQRKGHPHR
jgi:betaine-homocysteine S-methyltransferase